MRGVMAIGAITVAVVLLSLFLTNERAYGHHQEDTGPHCRYGINVYSPSTNQNLRIAEFGIHSRMNLVTLPKTRVIFLKLMLALISLLTLVFSRKIL